MILQVHCRINMKKTIIIIVLIVVAFIAWYGYREYNRTNVDLAKEKADVTITASELLQLFEKDSAAANKNYLEKIVAVFGNVKEIEKDNNSATIILGEEGSMSSVRCSMDTTYLHELASISKGKNITIKGNCTGFNRDELLGSDVILNRCVISKTN